MTTTNGTKRLILTGAFVLLAGALVAVLTWDKMFRLAPQPHWITADRRSEFVYGAAGEDKTAGIPYWIWLALPRIFPEYLPGPGGYASLGFSWEETREMPAGFAKQRRGYVRVAGNCALCHTYSVPNGPDAAPTVFAAGPGHVAELEKLLLFYKRCAQDPRFNATDLLDEISMATKLSFIDKLIYRFVLIPQTRERFLANRVGMVDPTLWAHSQHPQGDPALRQRLRELAGGLNGTEQEQLNRYLDTLR